MHTGELEPYSHRQNGKEAVFLRLPEAGKAAEHCPPPCSRRVSPKVGYVQGYLPHAPVFTLINLVTVYICEIKQPSEATNYCGI